jgi:predicted kinase
VLDATFLLAHGREALAARLEKETIPFRGFWVEAPDDVAESRLDKRVGDASDATVEVRRQQKQQNVGPLTWARLPGHESTETILQGIAA